MSYKSNPLSFPYSWPQPVILDMGIRHGDATELHSCQSDNLNINIGELGLTRLQRISYPFYIHRHSTSAICSTQVEPHQGKRRQGFRMERDKVRASASFLKSSDTESDHSSCLSLSWHLIIRTQVATGPLLSSNDDKALAVAVLCPVISRW